MENTVFVSKFSFPPVTRCPGVAMVLFLAISGLLSGTPALAQDFSKEELEAWFEDDSRSLPFDTDGNEGELDFLTKPPAKPVLHSNNRLTIKESTLGDGWVYLYQCFENLDAVPEAQVVYQYKKMQDLQVEKIHNIEKAWVEGQSVQMQNTQNGASLCISARVHILYKNKDNSYTLKNGPFQRKFLDGYFPMQVTLDITYPKDKLTLSRVQPETQPGFTLQEAPGKLLLNAWFEGKLFTEIRFQSAE